MKGTLSVFGLVALLGAATVGCVSSPPQSAAVLGEVKQAKLSLSGMTCASCTVAVKTALRRIEGVTEVEVEYESKQARVSYDSARVTPEKFVEAITQLGYQAILVPLGS